MVIKTDKQDINGLLLIDKPHGFSSNQTLSKIKWFYKPKKVGHTGTLDPLASGLLPICLGEATKFSSYLFEADKTYEAKIKLGFTSSTGDSEGKLENWNIVKFPDQSEIESAIKDFLGDIEQTPPMYSALKHEGKPLYKYAREGIEIERKKRSITISSINVINLIKDELLLEIDCSKGTYIRTLAEDLGKKLNVGGYLIGLRRTRIGSHSINNATSLELIEESSNEDRLGLVKPIESFLNEFQSLILTQEEEGSIKDGKIIQKNGVTDKLFRIFNGDNKFIGLAEGDLAGNLKVKRLMAL